MISRALRTTDHLKFGGILHELAIVTDFTADIPSVGPSSFALELRLELSISLRTVTSSHLSTPLIVDS